MLYTQLKMLFVLAVILSLSGTLSLEVLPTEPRDQIGSTQQKLIMFTF